MEFFQNMVYELRGAASKFIHICLHFHSPSKAEMSFNAVSVKRQFFNKTDG